MNVFSALGSYFQPQAFTAQGLAPGLTGDAQRRGRSQSLPPQDSNDVMLSDAGKALARQTVGDTSSLLHRVSDLGNATSDTAQKFLANVADSLFGDAAKGMNVSFDTVSVSASSSFSSTFQHVQDSHGSSDSATLTLADASDFVGKGTITTADGHRFNFEVEVHYESRLEMSASSTSTNSASVSNGNTGDSQTGAAAPIPQQPAAPRDGLAAHFPGSVADLLKMFGQGALALPFQGPASDDQAGAPKLGSLKLRLLDMIANPDTVAGKLAKSYGDLASSRSVAEQA